MKLQIITIIMIMFSMTLISAYYAGEEVIIPLDFEIVNCSIIDNTYNLDGLSLSWDGSDIIFSTVPNFKPDTFVISCEVIKYKEPPVHYSFGSGGGGSSSTTTTTEENKTEEVVEETEVVDEVIDVVTEEKSYLWVWITIVIVSLIVIVVLIINYLRNK